MPAQDDLAPYFAGRWTGAPRRRPVPGDDPRRRARDYPGFPFDVADVRNLPFEDSSLACGRVLVLAHVSRTGGSARAFGEAGAGRPAGRSTSRRPSRRVTIGFDGAGEPLASNYSTLSCGSQFNEENCTAGARRGSAGRPKSWHDAEPADVDLPLGHSSSSALRSMLDGVRGIRRQWFARTRRSRSSPALKGRREVASRPDDPRQLTGTPGADPPVRDT